MALFDIFKQKQVKESNSMFGQTALGNNVLWGSSNKYNSANSQILYVTTGSSSSHLAVQMARPASRLSKAW